MTGVKRNIDPEELERQVVVMTRQGMSAREIGEVVGRTSRQVVRIRRAAGVAQPKPAPIPDDVIEKAREMLEDGCSYPEVARTFGVSSAGISARLPGYAWPAADVIAYANLCRRNAGVLK